MSDKPKPWISIEAGGAVLHIPVEGGEPFSLPINPDGAHALIGLLAEYCANTDMQKAIASKAVNFLIDWWAKR